MVTPRPLYSQLPSSLALKLLPKELALISSTGIVGVLESWHQKPKAWVSAKLHPPAIFGPYLLVNFSDEISLPGAAKAPVGFSVFNRGWTRLCSFSELSLGTELPHVPYDLDFLYWKGLSSNLN